MGQLHPHVAQAAQADHADLLARAHLPLPQRRVGGDAGAQQGRDRRQVRLVGHPQHEAFVDHDPAGIAAVGHGSGLRVGAVVGHGEGRTVLFQALPAVGTGSAGIDQAAHAGQIAGLEGGDFAADLGDSADDLVARHHRIDSVVPLVAGRMQVGMAHPAVEDFDLHVARTRLAPLEVKPIQRGRRAPGSVSKRFDHGGGLRTNGWECAILPGSGLGSRPHRLWIE